MPKKNNKRNGSGIRNGNRRQGGPTPKPKRTLTKKFQYIEKIQPDNATSTYAYFSKYMRPDITKCVGAIAQFDAYELWRLKRIRVSIQAAVTPSTASSFTNINSVASTNIWTAADYGTNETVSGESIMQYQNAKRNTLSLNGWKTIVDTDCKINCGLNTATTTDSATWTFVAPTDFWVNTSKFDSGMYSGYQMFLQMLGFNNFSPGTLPEFNLQTELSVEFLQPAFQTGVSSFTNRIYAAVLYLLPDATDLTLYSGYRFSGLRHQLDGTGNKSYTVRFERIDSTIIGPAHVTYTDTEFKTLYEVQLSGAYCGNRRIKYDGPVPETYYT